MKDTSKRALKGLINLISLLGLVSTMYLPILFSEMMIDYYQYQGSTKIVVYIMGYISALYIYRLVLRLNDSTNTNKLQATNSMAKEADPLLASDQIKIKGEETKEMVKKKATTKKVASKKKKSSKK